MRHRWGHRKLGRTTEHRISLLRNMASQLIVEERLETTLEKAKELRSYVEKLITTAREDSVAHRRLVTARLHNYRLSHDPKNRDDVVKLLFNDVAPRFIDRPGGYTRILKTDVRRGDAAQMAIIELVARRKQEAVAAPPDAAKPAESKASSAAGRLTRRLLGGAKKTEGADEAKPAKPPKKAAGKKQGAGKAAAPKPEKTSKKTTKGAPKKAAKKSSKGQ